MVTHAVLSDGFIPAAPQPRLPDLSRHTAEVNTQFVFLGVASGSASSGSARGMQRVSRRRQGRAARKRLSLTD